ncbi:MAG: cobyrinate a,c-diamide synthase [Litoreibacter sp.]|nr:cobyrinate a,c-diamide synthase [Litoreibacter sp.]
MPGLIIAAPTSGSGKTSITLGLLRAIRDKKIPVRAAKSGPDYIDPKFHEAACGAPCFNLDAWAMTPDRIRDMAAGDELLLIEGAMGLFDGAPPDGKGAVADLARILKLPVVLVVDAARMAQSAAPLVQGFANHDPDVRIAGVILNKLGSPRHARLLRTSLEQAGIKVFGAVMRDQDLSNPSRHLGLVQAHERSDLEWFLDGAAAQVSEQVDIDALLQEAAPRPQSVATRPMPLSLCHVAVARAAAFTFIYPHLLQEWIQSGVTLSIFSPLNDDPVPPADLIYLPGGYPELHAARLSQAQTFKASLAKASKTTEIYGECGGYMVLGETLIDGDGRAHEMTGLLPLDTSFADRKLHLGYRNLNAHKGPFKGQFKGHEFHYATTLRAEGEPLFTARDAEGNSLPAMGLVKGHVSGSFAHIIDRVLL